ncbi:MAG TPA: ATP-binding protein [Anaerolineae bacterium]|nr:ATP-binding protein [Anaerolineae bacterium]HQI85468.1 ATP-binding protein [Anaerolineae bacterium]
MTESELDVWFPRPKPVDAAVLGNVVSGSLSRGLEAKLSPDRFIEGLAVGRYVVVRGQTERRFFGMITDVALETRAPELEQSPPEDPDGFLARVYRGTLTYGRIHVTPMLVVEEGAVRPAKTIPSHFTRVYEATPEEVAQIFGDPDEPGRFYIGEPLEMENTRIALDLPRFVERSSGIFGKSGTGKTFLTRMVLAGIIQQRAAVNLIFDMHNEYGWKSQDEAKQDVKGLRQLFFDGRVTVFTLDPDSSRRRGSKVDFNVTIGYDQLEPEDLELLTPLFGFTEVQSNALYMLRRRLGTAWVRRLLAEEPDETLIAILESNQLHEGTLGAIKRKLEQLRRFDFLVDKAPDDPIGRILDYINSNVSVILEFGRYGNALEAYILVANYITRRIHQAYVDRKESALGGKGNEPRPLVITIEEAHKFLDPAIARHTIFGTIAREMRKYNVTLLVVDQRPSGIDPEVMSQIGTRVTALLDEENDIRAVFSGLAGTAALREVLARLETKQQAMILGHAVPMPIVVHTRDYQDLYGEIAGKGIDVQDAAAALFG